MKKKIFTILFLLNMILFNALASTNSIFIEAKIDDEIITNYDLIKESNYLTILNPNLKSLDASRLYNFAKTSLTKEKIKKKEIEKFYDLKKENSIVENQLKILLKQLRLNDINQFDQLLSENTNYSINEIKDKIKLEILWNDLIYNKYKSLVKINKDEINSKINQIETKKETRYLLSEISLKKNKDEEMLQIYDKIKKSINEIGFNNAATLYSVSESNKFGGKLGWINENNLSENIIKELRLISEGEFTKIISLKDSFLILKVEKKETIQFEIDKNKEIEKIINQKTNEQLNRFSNIYFDKIKINYKIN